MFGITIYKNVYDKEPRIAYFSDLEALYKEFIFHDLEREKITKEYRLKIYHENNLPRFKRGIYRLTTEYKYILEPSLIALDFDEWNDKYFDAFKKYQYIFHTTKRDTLESPRGRILLRATKKENVEYKTAVQQYIEELMKDNNIPKKSIDMSASISPVHYINLPLDDARIIFHSEGEEIITLKEKQISLTVIEDDKNKRKISFKDVTLLLNHYPATDLDYQPWLEVGMALHDYFKGTQEGLDFFKEWSKKDYNRYNVGAIHASWKSFNSNKNNLITFKTILARVKEKGIILKDLKRKTITEDLPEKIEKEIKQHENIILPEFDISFQLVPRSLWQGTRGEKLIPKATLNNFKILLDFYKIELGFDVIKKEIIASIQDKRITDFLEVICILQSLAEHNDFKVSCVKQYLEYFARQHEINSFKEWIESCTWDGKSRLQELYDTIEVEPGNIELRNLYIRKWLLQLIHVTCLNDSHIIKPSRFVLTFQSNQEYGKTSWFRSLLPENLIEKNSTIREKFIKDGMTIDTNKDMSILGCVSYAMVELGEVMGTFKKSDQNTLKNFLSSTHDTLNVKYIAKPMTYRRRTIFFGSVNPEIFLCDETGNSRYLVLPVKKCNFLHNVDMHQLLQEVYLLALAGETYWLSDEEKKLRDNFNKNFEERCSIYDKFTRLFEIDVISRPNFMSVTETLETLGFTINEISRSRKLKSALIKIFRDFGYIENTTKRRWNLPPLKTTIPLVR